jgi:tRNA dimethylallyltransferase
VIRDIHARNRLPIVVGGTGLYLRAKFDGLAPARHDEALRTRLRQQYTAKPVVLHRFLRRFDPAAAQRIHPHDTQKLLRAVELTLVQRQPATLAQAQPRDRFTGVTVLKLGLLPDRGLLHARLNLRSTHLFQHGLVAEVEHLLAAGIPADAKPLQSVGYKQAVDFLAGHLSLPEAIEICSARTRQYAKRQITWFRNQEHVHWLHGFGSDPQIQQTALPLVLELLRKF